MTTHAPSDDRHVPSSHEGKLEPNWFCRGWNGKRGKYCRARAGHGTSHIGVGRCSKHGGLKVDGDARVRSGQHSLVKSERLKDLVETEKQRRDPLELTEELALLRALRADLVTRDAVDDVALQRLVEAAGRMVERIEKIRSANAISRPELNRIMHEMWRAVDGRIEDEAVKTAIRDDWMRIAL